MDTPVQQATPAPVTTPASTTPAPSQVPVPPKTDKKKSPLLLFLLIVVVLLVVAGGGYLWYVSSQAKKTTQTVETVKVGVMLPFSGGSSSMGYGAMKGIQLAKKQLNANNIELIQADGKCDPKTAAESMKKLIDQKVVVVIGEACSSASVGALPLANQYKIPLLSPSASSPRLSIANDYFFRTVPPDTGQGEFLAKTVYKQGIHRAAIFYTNEPYGAGINAVFKEKFEAQGGTVVVATPAESSVIDVQTQVNTIKAAKPEGLVILTNSTVSSTAVMKLSRASGLTIPFFGGDNLYDNTVITNGGAAAEGLKVVSFPTGSKSFKQALFNEYHVAEQLYATPEAYDALKAVSLAIQKGARTGEQFKEILPTITFEGASGPIKFDNMGEISATNYKYDLLEVKDGTFTIVGQ